MSFEVVMPKMGESIVEGTIIEWKKKVGEHISKDETLLEISTDKVDSEIPSPHEGTIIEILFAQNDTVSVGEVIAIIGAEGEKADKKHVTNKAKAEEYIEKPILSEKEKSEPNVKTIENNSDNKKTTRFFSPLVKSIAKKENINLSELEELEGSGVNGRFTKKDIIKYIEQPSKQIDKPVGVSVDNQVIEKLGKVEPMSHIRKVIASHMVKSLNTSPHVYSSVEVDVTPIVEYVKNFKDRYLKQYDLKLTYTPIFIEACIKAIQKFPLINTSIIDEKIHYHKNINMGVAVALDNNELIVPVINYSDEKNFLGILRSVSDLAKRARTGDLDPSEASGSTFTITNPGVFGSLFGMGIINQPNVAILSTGSIEKKPIVKETEFGDAVFVRSIMYLTLGYDHRIIDGAYGSQFLVEIKKYLETYDGSQDV
ncbi:MAG: diapophytoene dehydrogenase [Candidatus Marinimicrobia bacterium]|nr:diapophytoene dehydrogenase [Candidatus Neomarinimicrobiota bacterium]|tara:strand:- start:1424 stop:2701 length:1278 start_codon:yes stop_codon:yes gene_type:complete